MQKQQKSYTRNRADKKTRGSITVEFAITLILLFLFLTTYLLISSGLVGHERETYAAYVGARANAVGANVNRAVTMVRGKTSEVRGDRVTVRDELEMPIDFNQWVFPRKDRTYTVEQELRVAVEQRDSGDNMWMPTRSIFGLGSNKDTNFSPLDKPSSLIDPNNDGEQCKLYCCGEKP